jgi:3-methylcrotonyl-CoA carboxylase alpha subunit
VQVFGDSHGQVVHLFERDCSLQRRHQKVIEEAPAPGMDEATRAAVRGGRARGAAVDMGAGTVEFIADASEGLRADRIWFMEMNTRLQVEHPVTEAITGQDLVEWQIRVASGEPLPCAQDDAHHRLGDGSAALCRRPGQGLSPPIGRLDHLHSRSAPGGRVDTGVARGTISPFYDPMIAKLIAHAPPAKRRGSGLPPCSMAPPSGRCAPTPRSWPRAGPSGVRGRHGRYRPDRARRGGHGRGATAFPGGAGLRCPRASSRRAWRRACASMPPRPAPGISCSMALIAIALDSNHATHTPERATLVCEGGQAWRLEPWHHQASDAASAGDGAILAPMPGRVIAVDVAQGQAVTKGQKLLTLEAMKMEHTLLAPFDGVVEALETEAGAQVQVDALLARIAHQEA